MNNERIDSAIAEQILQGDDTDPDILQSLGLELLAELKRCYEEIDSLQGKIDKANYAMQRYCDEWPDLPYPDHRIDNVCDAYDEVCLALE